MGWSDLDAIEERIATLEGLERAQEQDRHEYNAAVANGLIGKARHIDRRMKRRARRIQST